MEIRTSKFDKFQNQEISKTTLINDNNIEASFLNMGAIWNEFIVPSKNGKKNLLLNFETTRDYYSNPFYLGMAIGRTGGRIKNGQMPLNNQPVSLPTNEGNNTLHGGPNGFHSYLWNSETKQDENSVAVIYSREITNQDDGYPGDIKVFIEYKLTNNNDITITYTGQTTEDTFFNPTCHAYFNLGESSDILNHSLKINSDSYLEVDSEKIPTGKLISVENTPFDFRNGQNLGTAISKMQTTSEKGFDDIFKVNLSSQIPIVTLSDNDSESKIDIYSERNGLVVFTANSFTEDMNLNIGSGKPYMGIALEPQTLSDTYNHSDFGDVMLRSKDIGSHSITYKYSTNNQ